MNNNMEIIIFKIFGVVGLVLLCIGITVKNRDTRDIFSILGGAALLIYSIYLKDIIFIILQSVYILVTIFDYIKLKQIKN